VVVPQDSIDQARELSAGWDPITVTAGGDTRQNSVSSGLEEISSDLVLIHDAARPFATRELIGRVVAELVEYDGAIPALPLDETVKRVHDERVAETIDRERLWAVQTPQGFRTDVLRRAHEKAREEGIEGTDDATLVERYGGTIKVVRGLRSNLKITYPEDFEIAEALAHGVER
jgi:2-C-methyl-D-erythritol 4-phosphate cytidylyltransferase